MDFFLVALLFVAFMLPLTWGGFLAFSRNPFIAALFLIFATPLFWIWGLAEIYISIFEKSSSRNAPGAEPEED